MNPVNISCKKVTAGDARSPSVTSGNSKAQLRSCLVLKTFGIALPAAIGGLAGSVCFKQKREKERCGMKIEEAIKKMSIECEKSPELVPLEEYLTGICTTDEIAEKILAKDKTLKGAMDKIRTKAKKDAVSGVGIVSDTEAFGMVREYYGIVLGGPKKPKKDIIDLDDLL